VTGLINSGTFAEPLSTNVTNHTCTIPYACAIGTTLAVALVTNGAAPATATMTDAGGNTYRRVLMAADAATNETVYLFIGTITVARAANATVTVTLGSTRNRWAWVHGLWDDIVSAATDQGSPATSTGAAGSALAWTVGPSGTPTANMRILRLCAFATTSAGGTVTMSTVDLIGQATTAIGSSDRSITLGAFYTDTGAIPSGLTVNGSRDTTSAWVGGIGLVQEAVGTAFTGSATLSGGGTLSVLGPTLTGRPKVWNGSAWVNKPAKVNSVVTTVRRYNGSSWVPVK